MSRGIVAYLAPAHHFFTSDFHTFIVTSQDPVSVSLNAIMNIIAACTATWCTISFMLSESIISVHMFILALM